MKPYNPYKQAREMGHSHEASLVFASHGIIEEETKNLYLDLNKDQMNIVVAHARQDISAMTMILASIGAQQRRIQWLLSGCLISLSIIAVAITAMLR